MMRSTGHSHGFSDAASTRRVARARRADQLVRVALVALVLGFLLSAPLVAWMAGWADEWRAVRAIVEPSLRFFPYDVWPASSEPVTALAQKYVEGNPSAYPPGTDLGDATITAFPSGSEVLLRIDCGPYRFESHQGGGWAGVRTWVAVLLSLGALLVALGLLGIIAWLWFRQRLRRCMRAFAAPTRVGA